MTTRAKKIAELSSNALKLVEGLENLKERLDSFKVAENALDSVSKSLSGLVEESSNQTKISNQMLTSISAISSDSVLTQIESITEKVARESLGEIKSSLDGVASKTDKKIHSYSGLSSKTAPNFHKGE